MKNVLITAIGSFSADIAIKTCHEELGWRVVGCDIYPMEWIAQSMNVDVFYQAPRASQADEYMDFIKKVCEAEEIDYLLPSTDVEIDVLNARRGELPERTRLCISGPKTIEICRDKKIFADKVRCSIPTEYLKNVPEADYPVIVKPVNGRSSQGLKRIYTAEEYALARNDDEGDLIVQPMIAGDIVTVDVVRHPKSRYVEVLPRVELLRTLAGAGTSVKIYRDSFLEDLCREIAEDLRIVGCVCFEFIHDPDGHYHIMECNPRLSGGVAFSVMAGYNFVKAHFDCFCADDIEVKPDIEEMYIARKYQEYVM